MINIKQFNLLIKTMKAMKCEMYMVFPDRIIGSDINCITLTEVFLNTGIEHRSASIEINKESLKAMEEAAKNYTATHSKEEIENASFDILFSYLGIARISDPPLFISYNKLIGEMGRCVDTKLNIREDEEFENCLSLKSKDGMSLYIAKGYYGIYPISIFTGLLPINKKDKVSLEIYENTVSTFLAKFIIDKGFIIINKYIKYIYL